MASSFLFERRGLVVTLRICLLGAVLLGAALGFSAFVLEWSFDFSAQAFEESIQSWGAWGVLANRDNFVHGRLLFPCGS